MDEGEISSMIEDLGIEKPGHIMKCLSWLKASVSVNTRPNDPKLHHTASKKLVQTTLTLCKGQLLSKEEQLLFLHAHGKIFETTSKDR